MTTTDLDETAPAPDETEPSPPSDGAESAAPETTESERERELQRRLTQQGREVAEARRQAAFQQATLSQLQSQVQLLTANLSEQQRQEAARRQKEQDDYLKTLPPEQRLDARIDMLGEQIRGLQTAATPSRPVQQPAAPTPPPAGEDASLAYMRQRAIDIVNEAQQEFGVRVDISQFSDAAWETEDTFYKAVMREAARAGSNGEEPVPAKKPPANETPQQMQARIRREVEESLGVSSPTAPRSAPRRATKPTAEDVRAAVDSYKSDRGPRQQVAKLREMREKMG